MDWYPKRTFGDLPREMAARYGEREALVFGSRRFTFAELDRRIDRVARGLMGLGVEAGDHVSLWLNNSPEWIFLLFALARIGAVHVPINTRFRARDARYVLHQSDSRFLLTHERSGPIGYLDMVREIVRLPDSGTRVIDEAFPRLEGIVILGADPDGAPSGVVLWEDMLRQGDGVPEESLLVRSRAVDPDGPVFIMYTSGTTGFPKGVVHSHKLIRNVEERAWRMAITADDVILNYLPLFHAFGYSEGPLVQMVTGARQVLMEIFDPDEALDLVAREKVTVMHGFEAHMKGLTEAQLARPRDLSSLRTGIFAAGMHSATPVVRRGVRVLAPLAPVSGFGMTEIWLGAALGSLDDDEFHRTESSGYPGLGYELRIVDPETTHPCAVGCPGELQVRGASLMLGYYRKPEETEAAYTGDGWFRTGDCAQWLPDGYVRFLGRYKDMLKIGGENVDPMEVEGLLLEHPGVHQVAVVGLPDERLSEVAVAFVERAPGAELDGESVIAWCRGKVASFKVPRHVVFVDAFPMTASGKIRKVDLREEAKRRLL